MGITRFEDMDCWMMARELTKAIYETVNTNENFRKDWGLKDQIRRASGSVMHNIAEGFDGGSNREFIRFLHYSKRSCTEVQSELYVALDQNYLTPSQFQTLYDVVGQTRARVKGLINYLNQHIDGPPNPGMSQPGTPNP
jgi:four helix bundle protein